MAMLSIQRFLLTSTQGKKKHKYTRLDYLFLGAEGSKNVY